MILKESVVFHKETVSIKKEELVFREEKRYGLNGGVVSHTEHHFLAPFWQLHEHLPPNSARIGYATEGALFVSMQLSANTVSALSKVWVLIRLWKQHSVQAHMKTSDVSATAKKRNLSWLKWFWFYLYWQKQCGQF